MRKITVLEDIWRSVSKSVSMSSGSPSANIKINNTGDGKVVFDITNIKEIVQ